MTNEERLEPVTTPPTGRDSGPMGAADPSLLQRIEIPKYVIYTQGILLGTVGIIAFVLGAGFGGLFSGNPSNLMDGQPCSVSGFVGHQRGDGQRLPDAGAVVVLLPADKRPDRRLPIEGLRPNEEFPPSDHPSLIGIRVIGGFYTRVDSRGRFMGQVAQAGDYFMLVLSNATTRPADSPLNKQHLAHIGRYFRDMIGLIGQRNYHWQRSRITPGAQLDVVF